MSLPGYNTKSNINYSEQDIPQKHICILETSTSPSGMHNRAIPGHILPATVVNGFKLSTLVHWHPARQDMAPTTALEIQS